MNHLQKLPALLLGGEASPTYASVEVGASGFTQNTLKIYGLSRHRFPRR